MYTELPVLDMRGHVGNALSTYLYKIVNYSNILIP